MKYKELPIEEARKECRKHTRKVGKKVLSNCKECPLRRERRDAKGNKHILFCYWELQDLISEMCEEYQDFREEEIEYYEERNETA